MVRFGRKKVLVNDFQVTLKIRYAPKIQEINWANTITQFRPKIDVTYTNTTKFLKGETSFDIHNGDIPRYRFDTTPLSLMLYVCGRCLVGR